jgi:uncharacterized damage-inducible protein DinB
MPIVDALLPEFDQEMANTRKVLERVPADKLGWRPHPKSFTMGALATHVATLPAWTVETFGRDELDIMPTGTEYQPPKEAQSREELLSRFDEGVTKGRAALASATDGVMFQNWSLLKGGVKLMTLPRAAVLRGFVLSHVIHHRAQLGVYLRLNDIPVPAIYGPTADESLF